MIDITLTMRIGRDREADQKPNLLGILTSSSPGKLSIGVHGAERTSRSLLAAPQFLLVAKGVIEQRCNPGGLLRDAGGGGQHLPQCVVRLPPTVPRIGAGNGGLEWPDVEGII